jgi:hypothetical protein
MDGKLRHRPKTFMKSSRFKKAVFKFKSIVKINSSDKKIRIVTKSRCGHPLNN